jgi:hypothetical protein
MGVFVAVMTVLGGCSTQEDVVAVQLAPGLSFEDLDIEEQIEILEVIGAAPEGALSVHEGEVLRWGLQVDDPIVRFNTCDDELDMSMARSSSGFSANQPLSLTAAATCSNANSSTGCQSTWGHKYCECSCGECGTVYTACDNSTNCSTKCATLTCNDSDTLSGKYALVR